MVAHNITLLKKVASFSYSLGMVCLIAGLLLSLFGAPVQSVYAQPPDTAEPTQPCNRCEPTKPCNSCTPQPPSTCYPPTKTKPPSTPTEVVPPPEESSTPIAPPTEIIPPPPEDTETPVPTPTAPPTDAIQPPEESSTPTTPPTPTDIILPPGNNQTPTPTTPATSTQVVPPPETTSTPLLPPTLRPPLRLTRTPISPQLIPQTGANRPGGSGESASLPQSQATGLFASLGLGLLGLGLVFHVLSRRLS